MKHRKISWIIALIAGSVLFATSAPAMKHRADHDKFGAMDYDNIQPMKAMNNSMDYGQSVMIMLDEEVQEGVKAMVRLTAIDSILLPANHLVTHHLMVMLTDAETGLAMDSGTVVVKIDSPDGKEATPIPLRGMQGYFAADVTLDQSGIWHFRISTKLADGKVRKYHGHYVVT